MRNRDRLDIGTQLGLTFEHNVVIPDRVILHVIIGMRRKRRTIRVYRFGVMRPRAVIALGAGDVAVSDPSPLSGRQIEGMDIRAEIIVVPAAKYDH